MKSFSKKGSSFIFIYAILFLFAIALVYVFFNQILQGSVQPAIMDNPGITVDAIQEGHLNQAVGWWKMFPFIAVVLFITYAVYWTANKRDEGAV